MKAYVDKTVAVTTVCVMFCTWALLLRADCTVEVCDEVRYSGIYVVGSGGTNCKEFQTDGADALLAANTKSENIKAFDQMGGTGTEHASIKFRQREWPTCDCECASGSPLHTDFSEVTAVYGTAGAWGNWWPAWYCKPAT